MKANKEAALSGPVPEADWPDRKTFVFEAALDRATENIGSFVKRMNHPVTPRCRQGNRNTVLTFHPFQKNLPLHVFPADFSISR
jgi:hypothetical protein